MNLPKAARAYDQQNEQAARDALARADELNVKKGRDIFMKGGRSGSRNPQLILYSPSGDPFYLAVADDGTLSATPL